MQPTQAWLDKRAEIAEQLTSPCDLNAYFSAPVIERTHPVRFSIGEIAISTNKVMVCDPFLLPDKSFSPFIEDIPPGTYEVVVCAVELPWDCARYAAVRLRFTGGTAVRYEQALTGEEDLDQLTANLGFPVQNGVAAIFSEETAFAASQFFSKWKSENPDKSIKEDYFASLFKQNASESPACQREKGDWLMWNIPGDQGVVPIFQSGFGNCTYPVYFGYDEEGNACCMVVLFIDIAFEFGATEGMVID